MDEWTTYRLTGDTLMEVSDGSDNLLLVEKWRDADALAAHGKQPHFARLGELKAEFVDETVIEKFEV